MRIDRPTLGNVLVLLLLAALAWGLWDLQTQPWPAPTPLPRPRLMAALASVAFLALCGWTARRARAPRLAATAASGDSWRVVYASQTGFALELAKRTAQTLRDAGQAAIVCDLARLDVAALPGTRCLFIASTTGEGDPPDHALAFANGPAAHTAELAGLEYAVLALGDSSYAHYCAFGRQLDAWLHASGARPLFDRIEVDNADPGALRHWQHNLGVVTGHTDQPDWTRPSYESWTLASRRLLNPGSAGGQAWHVVLQPPPGSSPRWQAGDIAEIGPRNPEAAVQGVLDATGLDSQTPVHWQQQALTLGDALSRSQLPEPATLAGTAGPQALADRLQPLPHREYSIASLPADGQLELLVRLMPREDDTPGLGSGWLCLHARPGAGIDLRIRGNPNFHAPDPARPLVLVGNGTGLAGLRAQLKARIAAGARRNWLLFGERNATHDAFFADELEAWLREGRLERLDRVYSRDGQPLRYVQDALRAHAGILREWVQEGASIYVCGSLSGMAPGVDAALAEILGAERLKALAGAGRYRRDVY